MSCLCWAAVRSLPNHHVLRLLRDVSASLVLVFARRIFPESVHIPKLTVNLPREVDYVLTCDL